MANSFILPGINYFGRGALKNLVDELNRLDGRQKVFLVSDQGLYSAGLVDKVSNIIKEANYEVVEFLETEQEPSIENVMYTYEQFTKNQCEIVIGLGGGSPLDVAKAVSILATNGGSIMDYAGVEQIPKPGIPKILIPTTAGTGAEVTKNAIFTDKKAGLKKGIVSRHFIPEVAIVDPELTLGLPPEITAATGMDALTHAIESYTSPKASIHTEMYALKAIEIIGSNLRKAVGNGNDFDAREQMAFGSVFAGISLANAGVGGVHAIAYPVGGNFGVGHGIANALLLPYVMDFNKTCDLRKFANIAIALGEAVDGKSLREQADMACEAVKQLSKDIGIPEKLTEVGVDKNAVDMLAEATMGVTRLLNNNPKIIRENDVRNILNKAI